VLRYEPLHLLNSAVRSDQPGSSRLTNLNIVKGSAHERSQRGKKMNGADLFHSDGPASKPIPHFLPFARALMIPVMARHQNVRKINRGRASEWRDFHSFVRKTKAVTAARAPTITNKNHFDCHLSHHHPTTSNPKPIDIPTTNRESNTIIMTSIITCVATSAAWCFCTASVRLWRLRLLFDRLCPAFGGRLV
jgi:hypothetical protein